MVAYFACSWGGIISVKLLNYQLLIAWPLVLAVASRSTWTLSLALHLALRDAPAAKPAQCGTSSCRWQKVLAYAMMGVGLAVSEVCNIVSMTVLPGSLYALLKGSDLSFNLLLSKLVLRKSFGAPQYAATVLVSAGVALNFFWQTGPAEQHAQAVANAERQAGVAYGTAVWMAVLAAFLNTLVTVCSERFLKPYLTPAQCSSKAVSGLSPPHTPSEAQSRCSAPEGLLLANQFGMYTSFACFVCLLATFMLDGARFSAPVHSAATSPALLSSGAVLLAFAACISLLVLARFGERLVKYWMISIHSSFFFNTTQALRRTSGVFVLGLLFDEVLTWQMLSGAVLCAAGFSLSLWPNVQVQLQAISGCQGNPSGAVAWMTLFNRYTRVSNTADAPRGITAP